MDLRRLHRLLLGVSRALTDFKCRFKYADDRRETWNKKRVLLLWCITDHNHGNANKYLEPSEITD